MCTPSICKLILSMYYVGPAKIGSTLEKEDCGDVGGTDSQLCEGCWYGRC